MTYVIANWSDLYETHETRKLENLRWCPCPNKLDGLGFRRMAAQRDRCDLYAAWNILRCVASRSAKEARGRLERDSKPLTPDDLAIMSGFPSSIFERAFSFFSSPEMGWLLQDSSSTTASTGLVSGESPVRTAASPGSTADAAGSTASSPAVEKRREGREEKVVGANESHPAPVSDEEWRRSLVADPAYRHIKVSDEFGKMQRWCQVNKKQPTRRRFINWLNRIEAPMRMLPASKTIRPQVEVLPTPELTDDQIAKNKAVIGPLVEQLRGKLRVEETAA